MVHLFDKFTPLAVSDKHFQDFIRAASGFDAPDGGFDPEPRAAFLVYEDRD